MLVVEHDEDAIRLADYVVDMGPGAGVHGGEVVAAGSLQDILDSPTSITGVSGSGKSTFTIDTLYNAAARELESTIANNVTEILEA